MKFNCGLTSIERRKLKFNKLGNWHKFFCLVPRRMPNGECRWLEYVERKGVLYAYRSGDIWYWTYRLDNENY